MDKKDFQIWLGTQIRLHRKAQGLSQEKLAELAEVHPTFISNVERGKISASTYNCYRIAHALNTDIINLFSPLAANINTSLEIDLVNISSKIRQMNENQQGLYISAIKGMLNI